MPVDISGDYLEQSAGELQQQFPAIDVLPVVADFARPFTLPDGSTICRSSASSPARPSAISCRAGDDLLRQFRALLGTGAHLLIGMDRVKPVERLLAAYDDPKA